ncbi:MAG TPA: hypothetical protein VGI22_20460 [Xanthobacteraceae bacterium]|jgi:hypothetical protein
MPVASKTAFPAAAVAKVDAIVANARRAEQLYHALVDALCLADAADLDAIAGCLELKAKEGPDAGFYREYASRVRRILRNRQPTPRPVT